MIANARELELTRENLSHMEASVSELRDRVYPVSRDRFSLMAESYLEEIKKLRAQIDEYTGISLALDATSDFLVRVAGPTTDEGTAPAPLVNSVIAALQVCFKRVGKFVAVRDQGAILERALGSHFDLEVLAVTPGSFRVGLRVSHPVEEDRLQGSKDAAFRLLSETLRLVARQEPREQFERVLPELNLQLQVLQGLKSLPPTRRQEGYVVQLGGRAFAQERLEFVPETRSFLAEVIRATTEDARQEGVVREINLDHRTFLIRTNVGSLRCKYAADLEESVKRLLDSQVRVVGRAKTLLDGTVKQLYVTAIERV